MDLSQLLVAAGSPDQSQRAPAEQQLKQLEQSDLATYLASLSHELGNEQRDPQVRQLAGLLLKNTMVAKSESSSALLAQRWLSLSDSVRNPIKHQLMQILGVQIKSIRNTAALVIAKIAGIEVPKQMWSDLVPGLVQNITNPSMNNLRAASFETLGYVCEEIPESLQNSSNLILNAIATGMAPTEQDNDIKLAATQALANSLDFIKNNFSNTQERELILQMIFGAINSQDIGVRVAAYQCLVEIASNYYEYLVQYISQIFTLTANAIQKEDESVALQAIEFWSTLAEEEIALAEEAAESTQTPERANQNYVKQAAPQLLPLLLGALTQQTSEDVDEQEWDKPQAAGTCLGLSAQAAGDTVVQIVLPFVEQNISSDNWRYKEAATLSFGAILDGPTHERLVPLVQYALPMLLNLLKDSNALVKDTAAWTIGRVCAIVPETINQDVLPHLIQSFLTALQDVPKVAAHVCWAIHNLANAIDTMDEPQTSPLSPHFTNLVSALLNAANRGDATEANLLTSTYEAINVLIHSAAQDTYALIGQLIPELLNRLNQTLSATNLQGEARERQNTIESALCGSLQMVVQKLDDSIVLPHADHMMTLFLRVLEQNNSTATEEALMAIGAIANRTGKQFEKYVPHLRPFLLQALSNSADYKVCTVAVGLVGDVSRALESSFAALGDDVMKVLLEHLQNTQIDRSVKPHIISAIGDIALATAGFFERYLTYVMRMLIGASQTMIDEREVDYDSLEYIQQLRESICEAYTGIIHGLATDNKQQLFLQTGNGGEAVIQFLDILARDTNGMTVNETLLRAAVGLIGDLANRLGNSISQYLRRPATETLIKLALQPNNEPSTQETAQYAQEQLLSVK